MSEWNPNNQPSSQEQQLTLDYDGLIKKAMAETNVANPARFTCRNGECFCDGLPVQEWIELNAEYDAREGNKH